MRYPLYNNNLVQTAYLHQSQSGHPVSAPARIGKEGLSKIDNGMERNGRSGRRVYRITPAGRRALAAEKVKVRELFGELFEHN